MVTTKRIKFSSPHVGSKVIQRTALILIALVLATAVLFGILLAVVAFLSGEHAYGIAVLLVAFGAGLFFTHEVRKWFQSLNKGFELFIDRDLVSVSAYDEQTDAYSTQRMRLSDIRAAEKDSSDSPTIFLHSQDSELQIPLWAFTAAEQNAIIDGLAASGVKVSDTAVLRS